ncbi:sigma-70 family RNA polymerase sigma factor [Andreesenia angusta]|nr:sigma-70 family RNA polymerase sigma factor [Andreesenia angusta]
MGKIKIKGIYTRRQVIGMSSDAYINRMREADYENYTFKDNIDLIREYKRTGDKDILEIIIIVNYSLLKKQARKYARVIEGSCLSEDDLIQMGYIGLMRAIEKFDISKNNSFSTYALYWIKQSMTREISNKNNSIRIPVYMVEQMLKLRKFEEDLDEDIGEEEKANLIEEKLDIDRDRYNEIKDYEKLFGGRLTSLDIEIGEEDSISLSDIISSDDSEDIVFDEIAINLLRENIMLGLRALSEREADILKLRYGIEDGNERTLEEIGQKYGLTRERIRQIEAKALWKLRNKKKIADLKDW